MPRGEHPQSTYLLFLYRSGSNTACKETSPKNFLCAERDKCDEVRKLQAFCWSPSPMAAVILANRCAPSHYWWDVCHAIRWLLSFWCGQNMPVWFPRKPLLTTNVLPSPAAATAHPLYRHNGSYCCRKFYEIKCNLIRSLLPLSTWESGHKGFKK